MAVPRLLIASVLLLLVGRIPPATGADIAAWVYDFPRWSGSQYEASVALLPPGTRQIYASVEDGPRFLLDDQFRAADIQRVVGAMRDQSGVAVHAILLQDTRWLDDPGGARERLTRILALNRFAPDRAFAGVHVDVEPHTLEDWECGGIPERRGLVEKLHTLLARLASAIPRPGKGGGGQLGLSAALPWWIGPLSAEIPEAAPRRFFESLDEIVLMAFGDPGGPLVGGTARALVDRLEDARLWRDIPAGKGIRVGLATYEYASADDLLAAIRELDRALTRHVGYRGTAIFHAAGSYGAPLAASLRGLVQDGAGRPVAGLRVKAGARQTATNRCGRFVFRDLPSSGLALEVGGFGSHRITVPVGGLTPGRELEIAPIVVRRLP